MTSGNLQRTDNRPDQEVSETANSAFDIESVLISADPLTKVEAGDSSPLRLPSDLPPDADSPEFSESLQILRKQFQDRTSYNFMVCDALAMRGVPPNSQVVVKVGRWGSSNSVASDVRSWYALLSRKLKATHANIPDAARIKANSLLEQLWELAKEMTTQPLVEKIRQLSAQQEQSSKEALELAAKISQLEAEASQLKSVLSSAEEARAQLESTLATERAQYESRINQLSLSISEAALAREAASREAQLALSAARQAAETAIAVEKAKLADAAKLHENAVAELKERIARLQEQAEAARKESALNIDRARQDVRDANARADHAEQRAAQERAEQTRLRDLNASMGIEMARVQMQSDMAKEQAAEALRQAKAREDALAEQLHQARASLDELQVNRQMEIEALANEVKNAPSK